MGQPDLPLQTVAANLEKGWPVLDELLAVENYCHAEPAIRIAAAAGEHAEAELAERNTRKSRMSRFAQDSNTTTNC